MSAIITAAYNNDFDTVRQLIENGANFNYISPDSESVLRIASRNGRFADIASLLKMDGDITQLEWNELARATAMGSLQEMTQCIKNGISLHAMDFWERTPWLIAVMTGDTEKVALLLEAGSDDDDRGRGEVTALTLAAQMHDINMMSWLLNQGFDIDDTDDYQESTLHDCAERNFVAGVALLIERGADLSLLNHSNQNALAKTTSAHVALLLINAGLDASDMNKEAHANLIGQQTEDSFDCSETEGSLDCSEEEFKKDRHPTFGTANPQIQDKPFWNAMVRAGCSAWSAPDSFELDTDNEEECKREWPPKNPTWCYNRFGRSFTILEDGRIIDIAGEHEDSYDPDFYIYNDVVVHDGKGDFKIYGYPREVFPPTDFHSATLVGEWIYIIGNLGYPDDRQLGVTPIYRLHSQSYAIEKVESSGNNPGWISFHRAKLSEGVICIEGGKIFNGKDLIDNELTFSFDLATLRWTQY